VTAPVFDLWGFLHVFQNVTYLRPCLFNSAPAPPGQRFPPWARFFYNRAPAGYDSLFISVCGWRSLFFHFPPFFGPPHVRRVNRAGRTGCSWGDSLLPSHVAPRVGPSEQVPVFPEFEAFLPRWLPQPGGFLLSPPELGRLSSDLRWGSGLVRFTPLFS